MISLPDRSSRLSRTLGPPSGGLRCFWVASILFESLPNFLRRVHVSAHRSGKATRSGKFGLSDRKLPRVLSSPPDQLRAAPHFKEARKYINARSTPCLGQIVV